MPQESFDSKARIEGSPRQTGALLEDTGFMLEQPQAKPVDSFPAVVGIGMADGSRFQMDATGDAVNTAAQGLANGRDPRVVELDFAQTSLSDAGLRAAVTLPNLHKLNLADTQISDAGLAGAARAGMKQVTELSLHSTGIGDAGLRSVVRLPRLDNLNMEDTAISNDGLAALRGSQLSILNLGYTAITDDGLKHLKDMPNLRVLNLEGDDITEDGLKHLWRCRKLQVLNLNDTKLTDKDIDKLQKKLPSTLIVRPNGSYGQEGMQGLPPAPEPPGLLRRLLTPTGL